MPDEKVKMAQLVINLNRGNDEVEQAVAAVASKLPAVRVAMGQC